MGRIIALLAGGSGIFWLIGALLVVSAAGAAGGYKARGLVDAPIISAEQTKTAQAGERTQTCIAQHERARADGGEKVVTALRGSITNLQAVTDDLTKKANRRNADYRDFIERLRNVPETKICGTSGPELEYRRSVQP